MDKFLKKELLRLGIAFIMIGSGLLLLQFTTAKHFLPTLINKVTNSMNTISQTAIDSAVDIVKKEKTAAEYEEEISKLKEELRKLRIVAIDYYSAIEENTQYLKFYNLQKDNKSLEFIKGSVISRDPNEMFFGMTLDKGIANGVSVGCPVITENGLVGRVVEADMVSCKVKTILSPDVKVGVTAKQSGDSGVLEGNITLAGKNLTKMKYLSTNHKINVGDIVATTGITGIYPKDIPVGTIKEIKHDEFDSSFYAEVEPFDNIREIGKVFIVTNFLGKNQIEGLETTAKKK